MTVPVDTEERFCDESGIAKVRKQLSMSGYIGGRLAFLLLSGSFNPIHTSHLLYSAQDEKGTLKISDGP